MVMTETRESKIVIYQKGLDSKEDYGTVNLKNEKAMKTTKSNKANLENKRFLFFEVGVILVLAGIGEVTQRI